MKTRTIVGLVVMIVGILMTVYGAFLLVEDGPKGSMPQIVGFDAVMALTGGVVFIFGVVVQGARHIYALIVHLLAAIPYYLAITGVQSLGQQGTADASKYIAQTDLYWAVGIILNILGILLNRIVKKQKVAASPQLPPTVTTTPTKK